MNKPSPLIPQGALPQSAGRGASNVRIAVVTIIAIHIVFFGGLLMQGCKRDNKKNDLTTAEPTNGALTLPVMTNRETVVDTTPAPVATDLSTNYQTPGSQSNAPSLPSMVTQPEPTGGLPSSISSGQTSEYTIVRNDTLSKIAHAHGTTAGAIARANPGVDPAKLKIGQKIQIPAASSAAASPGATAAVGDASSGIAAPGNTGTTTHVVKAGETLTKIAHQHGTTVKAIRSANALKTDRVSVGQKLKIPAKSGATNAGTAAKPISVAHNVRGH
ncbi:MAG: cell wall lytic [Verrucomicrobiales bacterium]|nr:cell wall lytic [Verrucomicrobiales bacterium]